MLVIIKAEFEFIPQHNDKITNSKDREYISNHVVESFDFLNGELGNHNIPDPIYNALKNIDPNIEDSIIKAVELYTAQKNLSESDPFHNWLQTPVEDREKKTDISEKHDTYLYGFEK